MSSNITSANATAVMIINDLFPVGFAVEGFATDQAINQDEETLAVTRMGVDGKLSAGYTPSKRRCISLSNRLARHCHIFKR